MATGDDVRELAAQTIADLHAIKGWKKAELLLEYRPHTKCWTITVWRTKAEQTEEIYLRSHPDHGPDIICVLAIAHAKES